MNEQARYALIGACVLLILAGAIWFIIWMSEGMGQGASYYWVNFNESVTGLLPKAPVSFNGVTVGSVTKISIAPHNPKQVRVLLSVEDDTPINQSTIAQLDSMGLTGVAFVDLSAAKENAPKLKVLPGMAYPVIPSKISFFGSLSSNATSLSKNLVEVTHNLNALLNDKNQASIRNSLAHIDKFTATLAHNRDRFNETMGHINVASEQLPQAIKRLNNALSSLNNAGESVVHTSRSVRETSDLSRRMLSQLNQQTLPATSHMLNEMSQVSSQLQQVVKELKNNPSMLVRGKAMPASGPGE